ncbi:U3 small nucleolar RNA-associated protein 14 homolog A [Synchiropus splendidus]|uniref:U3 small nucleolar RNA-associated protein 14 homolog A n=1 Tax=Synchiropus splendidus TaxID=270530 RepID=UPI00237E05A6|nr:U3 small nucleolar RNA-associated protein 14 homolog A [Synchiropus splendidus]
MGGASVFTTVISSLRLPLHHVARVCVSVPKMAKAGEKSVKRMKRTRRPQKSKKKKKDSEAADRVVDEGVEVMYDDDDDDDEVGLDEDVTSEEEPDDDRRRQKLLEAISGICGQKRQLGERSEAAALMSEFAANIGGDGTKVQLSELLGQQTAAVPGSTIQQLNKLQQSHTLESPLSRQETERIQRDLAFQKAALEVTRWKAVIEQNRRAEQVVFPLNKDPAGPRPIERVVTSWRAQTPLEQEVFAVLSANKQPIYDPVLTPAEEASVQAMSLEDAKIRRAELQKVRALQSYYEAKARRDRKIKSKKYHKIQNKSKRKELLKQFEEKVKSDPAAALEDLEQLERNRMQERMSLKHQNSSKWAKSRVIVAKYDLEARRAMQAQLQLNRDLTQKVVLKESDDDEEEEQEQEEIPDFVNEVERESVNPWMSGRLREVEGAALVDGKEPGAGLDCVVREEQEEVLLRELEERRRKRNEEATCGEEEEESVDQELQLSQFASLYQELTSSSKEAECAADSAPGEGALTDLPTQEAAAAVEPLPKKVGGIKRKPELELSEVLTRECRVLSGPLGLAVEDGEEEGLDQRQVISEAFAGDDVVGDFLKEKRKRESDGEPAVVSLALPGWGEWGGSGVRPSKKKRRRFRVKPQTAVPRKDQKLPATIICEKRAAALGQHQVSMLPFPFIDHAHFESTMRSPLGRTWNTERSVRKMTAPRVVTRPGRIIEPMSRDQLQEPKHQREGGTLEVEGSGRKKRRRGRGGKPPLAGAAGSAG